MLTVFRALFKCLLNFILTFTLLIGHIISYPLCALKKQADIIEAFNSTSRYLDDLLNIDNPYFEQMVGQIYPTELQLNKANSSDTEAQFWT